MAYRVHRRARMSSNSQQFAEIDVDETRYIGAGTQGALDRLGAVCPVYRYVQMHRISFDRSRKYVQFIGMNMGTVYCWCANGGMSSSSV